MLFFTPVPHRKVKHHAREEATLCHAQDESCGEEASHILGHAQQGCDNAPDESECRKPNFGRGQSEDDITWYLTALVKHREPIMRLKTHFKKDVADEIQSQASQVLVPS